MTQVRQAEALLWPVSEGLDSGGKERGPVMFRGKLNRLRRWTVPECGSRVGNDDLGGSSYSG